MARIDFETRRVTRWLTDNCYTRPISRCAGATWTATGTSTTPFISRYLEEGRVAWFRNPRHRPGRRCRGAGRAAKPAHLPEAGGASGHRGGGTYAGRLGASSLVLEHRLRTLEDPQGTYGEGHCKLVWVRHAENRSTPVPDSIRAAIADSGARMSRVERSPERPGARTPGRTRPPSAPPRNSVAPGTAPAGRRQLQQLGLGRVQRGRVHRPVGSAASPARSRSRLISEVSRSWSSRPGHHPASRAISSISTGRSSTQRRRCRKYTGALSSTPSAWPARRRLHAARRAASRYAAGVPGH